MRTRDWRRHQIWRHMWRRLKEDRNQHFNDLSCSCWTSKKEMARFKEQPTICSRWCCGNRRRFDGDTVAERRLKGESRRRRTTRIAVS